MVSRERNDEHSHGVLFGDADTDRVGPADDLADDLTFLDLDEFDDDFAATDEGRGESVSPLSVWGNAPRIWSDQPADGASS